MRARLRFAALALPVLLLAACTDPAPPESSVSEASVAGARDACSLLSTNAVQPALAPPSQSPAATPAVSPAVEPVVKKVATNVGGALKPNFLVTQCSYLDAGGQAVIVTVYPPQKDNAFSGQLAELSDLTQNASQVTFGAQTASYQQTKTNAVIAVQDGNFVVTFAYPGSEPAGGPSREQRLANLVGSLLGVTPPSLPPAGSAVAQASAAPAATAAPPAGQPTSGATAAVTVNETDALVFASNDVTVKVGDVVQWTNQGALQHNVIFATQKSLNSPTMNKGDKFQVKFTVAGSYSYVCTFHVSSGMTGKITVQ